MTWQFGSAGLVLAALAVGFLWYERSRPSSKLLAAVAALAAAAVAGRVLFAAIPNVQATTDVVLLAGFALGAGPGFVVGAVAALASNFFLGQGPWTPWQMLGWGAVGICGAALGRLAGRQREPSRWLLVPVCALAGLAFGAWMDLFTLVSFAADRSGRSYLAISAASLPFNLAHAIGNAVLALALGPALARLLLRYRRRLEVSWHPAPGGSSLARAGRAAAATLALAMLAHAALGSDARAAGRPAAGPAAALRYLERSQNPDGGFGSAPGQSSNQLLTGWAAIGLEAAGRNPLDLRRRGRSPFDFMRSQARALTDTGEIERTIIALRGAGLSARRFAGSDLIAKLLARQRRDGSFHGQVNWTTFGILALRAAGRTASSPALERAVRFLVREQSSDGGFSFAPGGASDVDDTGAALQALAAAGHTRSRAVARSLSYLRREQSPDGGFGQLGGSRSNAQSTAWAIQGLVAVGRDPARFGSGSARSPLAYLRSLQQADGSFRYSRASAQTPVWVTAQALAAVRRKPLPLHPAARTKPAAKRAAAKDPARRSPAPGRAQLRAGRGRAPYRALTRTTAASPARPRNADPARVSARTASVALPRHHASPWWRTPVTAGAAGTALALLAGAWLARGRRVRSR